MKRAAIVLLALLLPAVATAQDMGAKYLAAIDSGGDLLTKGLIFHAPLNDPAAPLAIYKGAGPFTFTRAHDATHTATYVHPGTGLVTVADNNQLRIEAKGALLEGARTNILLWSRVFDNEAWTATNTAMAANQTGEDGVDNTAYSLWGTDNNGTLCQAVTIASAAYSGSISLKRISGSGTIKLSLDGGATWGSDVASSLSTAIWYRSAKLAQTLENPSFCVQIGTSGDNVAIDYAQLEAAAFPSSRIPTTTGAMTRNTDLLLVPVSGNINASVGSMSATVDIPAFHSAGHQVLSLGGSNGFFRRSTGTCFALYDGTASRIGPVWNTVGSTRIAGAYFTDAFRGSVNGGTVVGTAFDNDLNLGANMAIGSDTNGTQNVDGHIKNLRIWNRALSDVELQAVTR